MSTLHFTSPTCSRPCFRASFLKEFTLIKRHASELPFRQLRASSDQFHSLRNNYQSWRSLNNRKMGMTVYSSASPGPPNPSDSSSGSWKLWIVGALISVILPFWKNKWGPLLMFKEKVETAIEVADEVAEVIENVAEKVEKVADEVADHLPDGGKLRKAALFVENVARGTAKGANLADEFIDKVGDMEKEVVEEFLDQTNQAKEGNDKKIS